MSPSIVRPTTCVRNLHRRTEGANSGLLTTRASWSRIAVAGTGSASEFAGDFPKGKGCAVTADPRFIMPHDGLPCYGRVTGAYGRWEDRPHSLNPAVSESHAKRKDRQEQ